MPHGPSEVDMQSMIDSYLSAPDRPCLECDKKGEGQMADKQTELVFALNIFSSQFGGNLYDKVAFLRRFRGC